MTNDLPPMNREELEAKVTALLLGELPENEAALMRELIARDAGLARLQERLKLTLGFLRETAAADAAVPAPSAPLKLSHERREKLLASFKTVAPKEFKPQPRRRMVSWPVAVAGVAAMVILAGLLIPPLARSKYKEGTFGGGRAIPSFWESLLHRSPTIESRGAPSATTTAQVETADVEKQKDASKAIGFDSNPQQNLASLNQSAPASATAAPALGAPTFTGVLKNPNAPRSQAAPAPTLIVLPASVPSSATEPAIIRADQMNPSIGVQGGTGPTELSKQTGELESFAAGSLTRRFARRPYAGAPSTVILPAQSAPPGTDSAPAPLFTPSPGQVQSTNFYVDKDSGQFTVIADDNTSSATYKALSNSGNLRSDIGEGGGGAVLGEKKTTATVSGALQLDNKANSPLPPGWASNKVKSAEPADITYNFSALPLPKLLDIYQELVGRTLIYSSAGSLKLPKDVTVAFKTQTPLTRSEAIVALESVMGMNGITIIPVDDKFSKVVAGGVGAEAGLISPKTNFGVIVGPVATPVGQVQSADAPLPQPALPPPVPQPEVETRTNIFSTFSLNVSDAAFKLAQASLQNGVMPDAAGIRSEEFINAFDYRDPEPAPGAPVGFAWERAGYPFAHNRDLLRFSVKTAAQGRQNGRPLNLVLLLDKSGSMERADRVEIIHQALRVLASQLQPQDTLSVVVFARTARLLVDGVAGNQAGDVVNGLNSLTPEGGTNLEEAMKLAYATALRHYLAKGENRVVLLTDGAANLGSVDPEALKRSVAANRKQGIALDCFGVGFDGYNDNMMETLSRTGNGRYGFINTPEEAATEFAGKLAGALRVTASDVKVQLEFNPNRVTSYRQIGYAKHQLTKEQFRDNTVAAAQIGAAESGNALYTVQVNPLGDGPLCTVRVRFRVPGTTDYQEHAWDVPYTGTVVTLDKASPAMRLAATSAAFAEWLASSPYAGEVTPDQLLACLRGVPEVYGADARPKQLEWMIRQAKSMTGK